MFVPGKPFQPCLCLRVRPGWYPRVEHPESCYTQVGSGLTLNTRLGLKGLPGTNTLAYYENPYFHSTKPQESRGLHYKTLRFCNLPEMDIFCCKLVSYDLDKHVSLLRSLFCFYRGSIVIKRFMPVIYECLLYAKLFVIGKPLQPSPM